MPIVDIIKCANIYGLLTITDKMICAGFTQGGKDSCKVGNMDNIFYYFLRLIISIHSVFNIVSEILSIYMYSLRRSDPGFHFTVIYALYITVYMIFKNLEKLSLNPENQT